MGRWTWALVAGLTVAATPRIAAACGGTFCDGGTPTQPAQPVDQTGEAILFVLDGPNVEAHVQIHYDPETDADSFGWIVPVPSIPDFRVGSDVLFQRLARATVPAFGIRNGSCLDGEVPPTSPPSGFISMTDGGGGHGGFGPVRRDVVGLLDVAVLGEGTTDEVVGWLEDNGFDPDPAAEPILEDYVQRGWYFVAVRLAQSPGVSEIHPLVMTYEGDEPCVPLRLTSIAAVDDMQIRAFFVGDAQVVPSNWPLVEPNLAQLDWSTQGGNYTGVVSRAVDEVGGRGWVTEYAGTSAVVDDVFGGSFAGGIGLDDGVWDSAVFVDMDPIDVVAQLSVWDLGACGGSLTWGCSASNPMVLQLLREFIPAPPDLDEDEFYLCLPCYADRIDESTWDGPAFAAAFEARIVEPALHADELLATWPYLTRLYTTISPHEMTSDPLFHVEPGMADVDRRNVRATVGVCAAVTTYRLPDGENIPLDDDAWPSYCGAMPWAAGAVEIPAAGRPPISILDNGAKIDEELALYVELGCGAEPVRSKTSGDDSGTDDGTSSTGSLPGMKGEEVPYSCACRATRPSGPVQLAWLVLVGALGGLRRRPRTHR